MTQWLLTSICLLIIAVIWSLVEMRQRFELDGLQRRLGDVEGVIYER